MEILGKLGIDLHLLIAQIINFGILLWLLTKFVYRPVIHHIEQDEQRMQANQQQGDRLSAEQEKFSQEKGKDIRQAKKRAREIIKEAENVAEEIKQRVRDEAEQEKQAVIKQISERLQEIKKDFSHQ